MTMRVTPLAAIFDVSIYNNQKCIHLLRLYLWEPFWICPLEVFVQPQCPMESPTLLLSPNSRQE